jgi:hypothetical protein
MKRIGITYDGNYLVEMTQAEIRAFARLAQAVEGVAWDIVMMRDPHQVMTTYYDLENTFDCVLAFAATLFRVNDLHAMVGDLRASVMRKDVE